jgi:hypothetical protein
MYPDRTSLAYKVDHVGVSVTGAEPAFEFCRDKLGLPAAWPFAEYGPVRTGGIGLGNLNLELLEPSPLLPARDPAAVGLLAFQPAPLSVDGLVAALAHRGVGYQGPLTIVEGIFGFTNVLVRALGVDLTFFCSYHYPGSHDNAVRAAELSAVDGGTLGLQGVTELRAAVDVNACTAVLGPPTSTTWRFDTGPDLVADPSIKAGSAQMTWSVRDVAAAAQALVNLGAQRADDVFTIGPVRGLAVCLTQVSPARPRALARAGAAQGRPAC